MGCDTYRIVARVSDRRVLLYERLRWPEIDWEGKFDTNLTPTHANKGEHPR